MPFLNHWQFFYLSDPCLIWVRNLISLVLQHWFLCYCFIYNLNFIQNLKVIILSAAFLFHLSVISGGQLQHHHRWDIDGQQRVRILPVILSLGDTHRQVHREQWACPTVLQPELRQQQVSQTAHLSPMSWKDIWICRDWRYLFKASVVSAWFIYTVQSVNMVKWFIF